MTGKELVVNAPKMIWMTNDVGGYIQLSDLYLWIKFSDATEELEYKIDGYDVLQKFREYKQQFNLAGGKLLLLPNEVVEDGEKMLVIEIKKPKQDNFRVVVPKEEFKQVLYDFDAEKRNLASLFADLG